MAWAEGEIGWVHMSPGAAGGKVADAVRVVRGSTWLPYNADEGLRACDVVELVDPSARATIVLTNGTRLRLAGDKPRAALPCARNNTSANLVRFLKGVHGRTEERITIAASKAFPPPSQAVPGEQSDLNMRALAAGAATIGAGERALYLAWEGGAAPYSVEIRPAAGDKPLVALANIGSRSVTLPQASYAPGRYRLVLKGRDGGVREADLLVVAANEVPAMPAELAEASLDTDARNLFYADWLAGQEQGRWTLEALQRAAAFFRESAPARDWLTDWGG